MKKKAEVKKVEEPSIDHIFSAQLASLEPKEVKKDGQGEVQKGS